MLTPSGRRQYPPGWGGFRGGRWGVLCGKIRRMAAPSKSAADSIEFPLIRTKLAPPRMGSAPVSRDQLLKQLDERRDAKLTLVLGPAGCGKTTLLAQWRKSLFLRGAAVAWYYAGPDDDDALIAAYIVESLRQAGVEVGTEGLHVFTRSGGKAWKPLLASLVNLIEDTGKDVYLVIDDFHCVSSFAMLQLIDRWLTLAPPRFHLVLGSRMRPPLALDRLRGENQISEVQFTDLRFGQDETRRFLEVQGLTSLNAGQIATLHDITDGWAAGLQMLAFSLRKHANPETFFERQRSLSLSQEDALRSYLERAVAEHLSEDELQFLVRISACRRFNRELCELLTGNPRAREYLDRFVADNLFLIPIDTSDDEPWYRFHRLFAGFLASRREHYEESELRKLHLLASHWFAGKSLHIEALRHAATAGDADFSLDLVDRSARALVNGALFLQLLKWCESLPRERLRTRLNVLLCQAWAQLSCSRIDDFDRTLDDITQHPARNKPEVRTEVQLLSAYRHMRQDDTAAQMKIVEGMLDEKPPANAFHRLLLYAIGGLGLVYSNRFEKARDIARERHRHEGQGRRDNPKPFVDVIEGFSHLVQGHIRIAAELLAPVVEAARLGNELGADSQGIVAGYLIEARYRLNELADARHLLERFGELIDAVSTADGMLCAGRVRARLEQADGNIAAARQTLLRLEETGYRMRLDRIVAWSIHEQVLLGLAAREVSALPEQLRRLDELAQKYRAHKDCAWSEIPLAALMARAEHAAHLGEAAPALAAIEAASLAAEANRRQVLGVRMALLRALVLLRSGEREAALQTGRENLRLAAEYGAIRLLADLGAIAQPLVALLAQLELNPAERACIDAARTGEAADQPPVPDAAASGLLSSRELEVLHLLSRALSIKSIARGLNLSPGTVKWHLKNIYGKLGAVSREDALARSRGLGLLR